MHARDESWKFFKEGCIVDIYIGETDNKFAFRARCYRSLKKNEEPHYLHLLVAETTVKRLYIVLIVLVLEIVVDTVITFLNLYFNSLTILL